MWSRILQVLQHLWREGAICLVLLLALFASPALAAVSLSEAPTSRAGAVSGVAPVLTQPSDMSVAAGATANQEIQASDGDGDPLTFLKSSGPGFVTVSTTDPGSGTAVGNIHLAPGLSEAGAATATVAVTDGVHTDSRSFSISVQATPVAPVLTQPSDMTVSAGETGVQPLYASDANGGSLEFGLVSGPSFVTVTTNDPTGAAATGEIVVAPGFSNYGLASATVGVSDGLFTDQRSLAISVLRVNVPPTLTQPADMSLYEGETQDQGLTADDGNGDFLTFSMASGPAYMTVSTINGGTGSGNVRLAPSSGDAGAAIGTIRVSDGFLTDQKVLTITVNARVAPVLTQPADMTVRVNAITYQQITASDANGDPLEFSKASGPAYMTVTTVYAPAGLGLIQLTPGSGDLGSAVGEVQVTDGLLSDAASMHIQVVDETAPPEGVVYTNFGPNMEFDTDPFHSWGINGFFGSNVGKQGIANQFTPIVTDHYGSAEIGLVLFQGPGSVFVSLQADSIGLPGEVLEKIFVNGLTAIPSIFKVTSILHPELRGGTPYWLTVVTSAAGMLGGWTWNSIGDTNSGTNFAVTQGGSTDGPWGLDPSLGRPRSVFKINGIPSIEAAFVLEPHTINLKSHGANVTGYIELPIGFDASAIDVSTVRLAGSVPVAGPKAPVVGDHDGDGIPDIMVKFNQALLQPLLTPGTNRLAVTGALGSGEKFEGADSVRVIDPPNHAMSASISPNPLNPAGVLTFETVRAGAVSITLFDIQGHLVRRLVEAQMFAEGSHEVLVDGRGEAGQPLASGVYFYRVESLGGTITGRFAILK